MGRRAECGRHAWLRRRSAVSRQACHLLCVLAATLGARFEPLALAFLPALFKVLVITVQVGSHPCMSYSNPRESRPVVFTLE